VAHRDIATALSKYEAGEYRAAADLFLNAYKVVPDANLLFNAARCYERLGENRKAIVRYQQFLEAPDSEEGGKARANAALQRLEQAEFLAIRKRPTDTQRLVETSAPQVNETPGRQVALPWYLLSVGTLGVGAGAWSLWMGLSQQRQVTSDPAFDDSRHVHALTFAESQRLLASSERHVTWGVIGLGAGATLMTTAIVWLLLDATSDAAGAATFDVDVEASANRAAVNIGGRF